MGRKITAGLLKVDEGFLLGHQAAYVNEGCTYFFNAQHKYAQLKGYERAYFDYICEHMNARNLINLRPALREEFLAFYERVTNVKSIRSKRSLQQAEVKFKELHLVFLDPVHKKLHYVNPKHVYKGTLTERSKLLNRLAALTSSDPNIFKAIADVPFDSVVPNDELRNLPLPEEYRPGVV